MPQLSDEQVAHMRRQFTKYDSSGDGMLDFGEMASLLRRGNPDLGDRELRALFQEADLNGDGLIDFVEFVEYIHSDPVDKPSATEAPPEVEQAFRSCCGGTEMDGRTFAKFCRDAGITDRRVTTVQADLAFNKFKPKGERLLGYAEFEMALRELAAKKRISPENIFRLAASHESPTRHATQAEYTRFHDDPSTYTGVHATDGRHRHAARLAVPGGSPMQRSASEGARSPGRSMSPRPDRDRRAAGRGASPSPARGYWAPHDVWQEVGEVFNGYQGRADGVDGRAFAKLCKDCGLVGRGLKTSDLDVIFAKVVFKGERRATWEQFKDALQHIAERRGCTQEEIASQVAARGGEGPQFRGTQSERVRLHDDKSTYTGTHA